MNAEELLTIRGAFDSLWAALEARQGKITNPDHRAECKKFFFTAYVTALHALSHVSMAMTEDEACAWVTERNNEFETYIKTEPHGRPHS